MDKKLKKKWVKALRSGRYKQIQNTLVTNGGYCCLGVLARVMDPKGKRLDMGYPDNDVLDRHTAKTLATMNDEGGKSFPEIADYIESHL